MQPISRESIGGNARWLQVLIQPWYEWKPSLLNVLLLVLGRGQVGRVTSFWALRAPASFQAMIKCIL